jgi:hypothetical protein
VKNLCRRDAISSLARRLEKELVTVVMVFNFKFTTNKKLILYVQQKYLYTDFTFFHFKNFALLLYASIITEKN